MATSSDSTLLVNTIIHLMTVKLSSHNYLLWKNQMGHVFSFQNLASHIDGSVEAPAAEIEEGGKTAANAAYQTWAHADQKAIIILQASLSEEALGEVVGLKTARVANKIPTNITFDVIGQVVSNNPIRVMTNDDGVTRRILECTLRNLEGVEVACALWGEHATKLQEYLSAYINNDLPIAIVIQLAKFNIWRSTA